MPEVVTLESLEESQPQVPWRRPLPMTVPGVGRGLGCRVCIAALGLHGSEVGDLPQTAEEFAEHFRLAHGEEAVLR